jgi:hypothetical protein
MLDACIDHGCKGYGLGYATAWIKLPCGKKYSSTRHRKVFYEATGELPEVVRHKCDNPRCINIEHLEGGTHVDNMRDCKERGRQGDTRTFGAANGRTVLTPENVRAIRASYRKNSREHGLPALARQFGVGASQIHRVIKGVHHVATLE